MLGLATSHEPAETSTGSKEAGGPAKSGHGTAQRGDIQGMRAIAVLLVIASHAGIKHIFQGGYVGVDVFFVISGFLITGVLAREVTKTGRVSFATFYARRAKRILPAASVALLAIVVASALIYTNGHIDDVTKDVGWAAFFAANIHFAMAGTDYFAVTSFETPVQHFWSLAVEEQFYLAWPALLALMLVLPWRHRAWARKRTDGGRVGARTARRRRRALHRAAVLIAIICALSFIWSVHDTLASPQSAYYSTFTRAWELGLGALLALGAHRVARLPGEVKAVLSWVGLAMILVAAWKFSPATPFPGSAGLLPVVGAALVIAGGTEGPSYGAGKVLGLRPMRFIGDISYSLYLWHWPLLVMPAAIVAPEPLRIRYKLALIVLAIIVSWASYRWVETPFRTATLFRRRNLRALALWPVALAAVLVPTVAVYQSTVAQATSPSQAEQHKMMHDQGRGTLRTNVVKAAEQAKAGAPLPKTLLPTLVDLPADKSEPPDGCWASDRSTIEHKICPMGDTKSSTTVVLFGDSHAAQWLKPLDQMAEKQHIKLIPLIKAACLPADVTTMFHGQKYTQCAPYQQWAFKQIKRIQPELIITSGQTSIRVVDPKTGKPAPAEKGTELFKAGAKRTLEKLQTLAPRVDVISDQTKLPKDAEDCLGSRTADMSTCAEPLFTQSEKRDRAWKADAKATDSRFIDMVPYLCADGVCPLVINNTIVYRDNHHLTKTYATQLKPVLEHKIDFAALHKKTARQS